MNIQVCIGSACHVRGSYGILNEIKNLVGEYGLEDKVEVNVAFCLGACESGVSIKVDEDLIMGLTLENLREVFTKEVLERVK